MHTSHILIKNSKINKRVTDNKSVNLSINTSVLTRLFERGEICASDFQCLDCPSKQCVMKMCLKTCLGCKNI